MNNPFAILNLPLLVPFLLLIVAGVVMCNKALRDAKNRLKAIAQKEERDNPKWTDNMHSSMDESSQQPSLVSANAQLKAVATSRASAPFVPREWERAASTKRSPNEDYNRAWNDVKKAYNVRSAETDIQA